MKTLIIFVAIALTLGGCKTPTTSEAAPPLRSEREYAERNEAVAQSLHKTGQASSIEGARAEAAAASNEEWAAAAKAAEQKQSQDKFEKDLSKMKPDGE